MKIQYENFYFLLTSVMNLFSEHALVNCALNSFLKSKWFKNRSYLPDFTKKTSKSLQFPSFARTSLKRRQRVSPFRALPGLPSKPINPNAIRIQNADPLSLKMALPCLQIQSLRQKTCLPASLPCLWANSHPQKHFPV